jgi:chemotaxis protein MotB
MAAARRGRRRRGPQKAHENEERWLLTYADMITLLLALFIVLFSVSSVSVSKYGTLKASLRDAFSGAVLTGGKSIMQTGSSDTTKVTDSASAAIMPGSSSSRTAKAGDAAAREEEQELQRLKQRLDAYAARHGFSQRVETVVSRRGLVVRLLTDRVLFDSGESVLKSEGMPLLGEVSSLLQVDKRHPILVEGHTDDVPIHTAQYTSNWELSTARATQVTRYLIGRGVSERRFGAAGYADIHPLASNATATGRARNRRVEVVLQRIYQLPSSDNVAPDSSKGVTP